MIQAFRKTHGGSTPTPAQVKGAQVPSRPLPDGTALPPGKAVTIPVTITNQSNAPYGQLAGDEVAALPYSYKVG